MKPPIHNKHRYIMSFEFFNSRDLITIPCLFLQTFKQGVFAACTTISTMTLSMVLLVALITSAFAHPHFGKMEQIHSLIIKLIIIYYLLYYTM